MLKLAGNTADTIALKAHVHSAQQIVAMGPQVLAQKVPALGEARARDIVARAERTNAAALALWSEHAPALNRTGMTALPRLDAKALLDAAVGDEEQPGPIPDWETLFGSFRPLRLRRVQLRSRPRGVLRRPPPVSRRPRRARQAPRPVVRTSPRSS